MTYEEIREWVGGNAGLMPETQFSTDEIDHIAMCMEHILEWYYGRHDLGHFLTAVVRNDFRLACTKADTANRKALYLYALFVYNQLPADYIETRP